MGMSKYLFYKGQYYDVGTKVRLKRQWSDGTKIATYIGYGEYHEVHRSSLTSSIPEEYIVEIVEPVYYVPPQEQPKKTNGIWQWDDETFGGFIIYLIIMMVGSIFNDRWTIWIIGTWIFLTWKKHK